MKILSKDLFLSILNAKTVMAIFTLNVELPEGEDSDGLEITLTAPGYTQVGNTITVPIGTRVDWYASKPGFAPDSGSEVVFGNRTLTTRLANVDMSTLTVDPIPSTATVYIKSLDDPYWDNQGKTNSLRLPVGTKNVEIRVQQSDLNPYVKLIESVPASPDVQVAILKNTISIFVYDKDTGNEVPNPTVKINGDNVSTRTQDCNADVVWQVEKEGYLSDGNTIGRNSQGYVPNYVKVQDGEDKRLKIGLQKKLYAVRFTSDPVDAKIEASVAGRNPEYGYGELTVSGYLGEEISWAVSKENYVTKTGKFTIAENKSPDPIKLELKKYLIEVVPSAAGSASDIVVTIKEGDTVLKSGVGKQFVNVQKGTVLNYVVQKGSVIKTGSLTVTKDETVNVRLDVGTYSAKVFALNEDDFEGGYYCYPVYANSNRIVLSSNTGKFLNYSISGDSIQKTSIAEYGFINGFSAVDSAPEKMVFYTGYHNVDEIEDQAIQISINPNTNEIKEDTRTIFGESTWGALSFIKINQGWLGWASIKVGSVTKGKMYLNTQALYNVSGSLDYSCHLSKKDATTAIGKPLGTDIYKYTTEGESALYYDLNCKDVFVDNNGLIACAGSDGFALLNASNNNRVYFYAGQANRSMRLIGRISEYYYVVDYPTSSSASDQKTYIRIFNASTTGGLKESKELSVPGWTMTTKTVEVCRTIPQVSQTGHLLFIGASGSFGYKDPYVVRIQGY